VQQRLPSLLDPPIMFAHRGARALAPDNTIESFTLALKLGATGLESDVWMTSDGVPVLDHDGEFKVGRFRKRRIDETPAAELPDHVPTLGELFELCRGGEHISLDLKGTAVGPVVAAEARAFGEGLLERLWLCHHDLDVLTRLRAGHPDLKLIHSTRLRRIDEGPERHAARLAADGIDGVNLRNQDWTGGLVALFHRFERVAFAWNLQFEHHLRPAFRMGVDAVFSDHVDRMVDSFRIELGSGPPNPLD
jgi:glycerophosphoryl diester phosphodiesterase